MSSAPTPRTTIDIEQLEAQVAEHGQRVAEELHKDLRSKDKETSEGSERQEVGENAETEEGQLKGTQEDTTVKTRPVVRQFLESVVIPVLLDTSQYHTPGELLEARDCDDGSAMIRRRALPCVNCRNANVDCYVTEQPGQPRKQSCLTCRNIKKKCVFDGELPGVRNDEIQFALDELLKIKRHEVAKELRLMELGKRITEELGNCRIKRKDIRDSIQKLREELNRLGTVLNVELEYL